MLNSNVAGSSLQVNELQGQHASWQNASSQQQRTLRNMQRADTSEADGAEDVIQQKQHQADAAAELDALRAQASHSE